ncbi:MAG: c-type cytochrome [Proteobacteria bacterium]|nr:c-type cytochrome [Pseudomonadota bacterium]MBI3498872.1 c-type cytochrome [Pseudomonadota bacterium]
MRAAFGIGVAACLAATLIAWDGVAESAPERGRELFQRCAACHSLDARPKRMPGPSLRGVIGRSAGTLSGFDFSQAMIEAGRDRRLVWSEATMAEYLDDTDAYVPGTAMGYLRIAEPEDRQALIAYLKANGG